MKKSSPKFLLEVCVDSAESAIAAQMGGAHRVELCDNLMEGGTTPSAGAIEIARNNLAIGLHVIIRPRGGDFCYSELEYEIMCRDLRIAQELGADGVVIGILKPDGSVDKKRTRELIARARPMSVTFHRAFDMTRDPFLALETLIDLGVDHVLTSGQEESAVEGMELIADLVRRAGERTIIMPGGGINERNIARVLKATLAREIHLTAFSRVESPMQYRNHHTFMGGELRPPEYSHKMTDSRRVQAILRAAS